MRLAITLLGLDLLTIELDTETTAPSYDDEPGDYLSTPIGFVATHELPDEAGLRDRQIWDD